MTWSRSVVRAALAASLAVAASTALASDTPDRVAVVVGNQDYLRIDDLTNARNDAARIAGMLRDMGFTVFEDHDLDRAGFEALLRRAILNADDGAEIVFFYAGHGLQIGRRNYLLPVDVDFDSIYDLPVESITLDRVIDVLSARGAVHVAIIDACRDNPFPDTMLAGNLNAELFETRTGFDAFRTPINSLVAFSTAPGMVAYDGPEGANSPYTSAILETVERTPDESATELFAQVREAVYAATSGRQVPWESSTLVRPFRFRGAANPVSGTLVAANGEGDERAAAPDPNAPLPDAITLRAEFDRDMPLGPALAEALGAASAAGLVVAEAPTRGTLSTGAEGLIYAPILSERRVGANAPELDDAFVLSGGADGGQRIAVTLKVTPNPCDLQAGDALDPGGTGLHRLPNEIDIAPARAACAAAVAARPDTVRFLYQLGRAQQAGGEYEAAYASFREAADRGHVRALNATARLLTAEQLDRTVLAIPEDRRRAEEFLERGVAAGDPFAMHLLGRMLLRDGQDDVERERGFELLDRAAELGHTYSMNELGVYFLTKDAAHFLPERGLRYLEASAERGDIYGYHNLGFTALLGLVTGTPDYPAARSWFELAARGGHPRAPATLGRMIVRGQVPGATPRQALSWYDMGLARGDGWGGVNGASMVLNGEVSGVSVADALVRAAKAAQLPDIAPEALERARDMLGGASEPDLARAVQMLLNELGETVAVDGAIGPATRAAIARRLEDAGLTLPGGAVTDSLSALARAYWIANPVRSDLF